MTTIPNLNAAQIDDIIGRVIDFINERRHALLSGAIPLTSDERERFEAYFPEDILNNSRFIRVNKLSDPPFYAELVRLGFRALPQFSSMAAITFVDVIAAQVPFTDSLRFHELVHAVQYRQLGLPLFAERYVLGFLSGGGYEQIPLEQNAYGLEARFTKHPEQNIDVLKDVNCWIQDRRF